MGSLRAREYGKEERVQKHTLAIFIFRNLLKEEAKYTMKQQQEKLEAKNRASWNVREKESRGNRGTMSNKMTRTSAV